MTTPSGYTARPLENGDAEAVSELMNVFEAALLAEPDVTSPGDVRAWWTRLDLEADTRGLYAGDGSLAAAATLYERTAETLDLDAYVHPRHLGCGLGGGLIDWAEESARARGRGTVHTAALTADTAARELVTARGYRPVRHFYRMSIHLEELPPRPRWPDGVTVATFRRGEEEECSTR